ncbi:MAG TPA: acyl-ACP--UDP-N-acetylglucosamine O-acyltransferase [Candidatus Baltobacteraceae bacterium]|nr:acyl-ACP--UDP-N-acetylglucosamine O-acyltransferase [Candidatus Baltobacteraceae bacterium]
MIHPTAIVHPNAKIDRGVEIGPFCVIGEHVQIGRGTVLQAHIVINGWTTIGEDCQIYPFATIGAASQDKKYVGERAFTKIGSRTVVREYVSIQRATGDDEVTAVGDDCLLLAYVHIAHNCIVGNNVTMSNLAQLAGHCIVEDHAVLSGMAGVVQFTRVGRYAFVGGDSKVTRDVPPFFLVEGNPATPYGLNSVGLRRAGFSEEERAEIKKFYKLLNGSKLKLSEAIEAMRTEVSTPSGRQMLEFLEGESQRGILLK